MRPWLRSVMRKLAFGHSRSETRRAQREEIFYQHAPLNTEPDPLLEYGVDRQRLAEALETLPESYRSTLVQRYVEGRSCAEIAREEKVPAGTIRARQTRALALLRSELVDQQQRSRRTRRARMLWLLPALGIERAAAAVSRGLLALSGKSKLVGLVFVGLAVALGFHLFDEPRQDPSTGPGAAQSAAAGLQFAGGSSGVWSEMQRAQRERTERLLAAARARFLDTGSSDLSSPSLPGNAGPRERAARRSRGAGIDDESHPATRLLEDCWRDERGELRCLEPPMTPNLPGRPTCDLLNRNLAFIDTTRSTQLMNISYANRFLTAALLANMAVATNMGCQLEPDSPDGSGLGRDGLAEIDDPTCETHDGMNGGACTTCIDATGIATTVCAPADCYAQELADGTICTTCADQTGTTNSVCVDPLEDNPEQCFTMLVLNRMFCTGCVQDGERDVYCQPAKCEMNAAGCFTCSDADGHSYTNCDPESGGHCISDTPPGDNRFAARYTCANWDGTTSITHLWPGTETCETTISSDERCVICNYESTKGLPGGGTCLYDPNDPLPDPLAGLPTDLPAPGTCVTETSPGGFWTCTACALADGETKKTCEYSLSDTCTVYPMPDEYWCARCAYPDGTFSERCERPW